MGFPGWAVHSTEGRHPSRTLPAYHGHEKSPVEFVRRGFSAFSFSAYHPHLALIELGQRQGALTRRRKTLDHFAQDSYYLGHGHGFGRSLTTCSAACAPSCTA